MTATNKKVVHVAVGVIYNKAGNILTARRAANQHMGSFWEFPGGKLEAGETVNQALTRELHEELGITVNPRDQRPLCVIRYDYGDKCVLLDVWRIDHFEGEATGREGQPLRWLAPQKLHPEDFPPANRAIIRSIHLPEQIFIADIRYAPATDLAEQFMRLSGQSKLIRLRAAWPELKQSDIPGGTRLDIADSYLASVKHCLDSVDQSEVKIMIDLAPFAVKNPQYYLQQVLSLTENHGQLSGFHANHHLLSVSQTRNWLSMIRQRHHLLFATSCHNQQELTETEVLGADFAFLSPVLPTRSHPGAKTLGWQDFSTLARNTGVPLYALGGMREKHLLKAQQAGARGIAGKLRE